MKPISWINEKEGIYCVKFFCTTKKGAEKEKETKEFYCHHLKQMDLKDIFAKYNIKGHSVYGPLFLYANSIENSSISVSICMLDIQYARSNYYRITIGGKDEQQKNMTKLAEAVFANLEKHGYQEINL